MNNFVTGILFFIALTPSSNIENCSNYSDFHPVRSDIMMQVVLKSYGYYEDNIDGLFGSISKNALIQFQSQNNIAADGLIGSQTCKLLLKKSDIIKKLILIFQIKFLKNQTQQIIIHKKYMMLN